MSIVLACKTALPCERTRRFPTSVDNQTTCKVSVRLGENSMASKNIKLGELVVRGIPEAPARAERVLVTFKVDNVGRMLTVTALTSNGIKEVKQFDLNAALIDDDTTTEQLNFEAADLTPIPKTSKYSDQLLTFVNIVNSFGSPDMVTEEGLMRSIGVEGPGDRVFFLFNKSTPFPCIRTVNYKTAYHN